MPFCFVVGYFQIRSHSEVPSDHGFRGTLFNPLHETKTIEQSAYKAGLAGEGSGFLISLTPQKGTLGQDTDGHAIIVAVSSREVPSIMLPSPLIIQQ